ncbi:MAG: CRISPR-associated endonuclease Cas2 [Candidatus Lokiarchaeota archaeon]|nr:CRISPR-associated endonuclease Cas2 [Candidatus Lokiarchaeota archaeon]
MVYYLITYDVSSDFDKYRKKISDILIDYGLMRIQYSVFLGDIGTNEAREIASKINDRLNLKIPIDIRFFQICKSCLDSSFIITRDIKSSGLVASKMRNAINKYVSYFSSRKRETNISKEGWIEVYQKEGVGVAKRRNSKKKNIKIKKNPKDVDLDEETIIIDSKTYEKLKSTGEIEDFDEFIGLPDLEEFKKDVEEYEKEMRKLEGKNHKKNHNKNHQHNHKLENRKVKNKDEANKLITHRQKSPVKHVIEEESTDDIKIKNQKRKSEKTTLQKDKEPPSYIVTDKVTFI